MFGYEPAHKKARRLREERRKAPPSIPFARERPVHAQLGSPRVSEPAKPAKPAAPPTIASEDTFWGEAVMLDGVRPASAQEDAIPDVTVSPEVIGDSVLASPPPMLSEHAPGDGSWIVEDGSWEHAQPYTACDGCAQGSHCQGADCGGCMGCQGLLNWVEVFGGVHGATGPVNLGETASFGFQEGYNIGVPFTLLGARDLSAQMGMRVVHSNISAARSTPRERTQVFLTTGLFRRVDQGYQWGVAVDYLHDEWYFEPDLLQLRGELSYLWNPAGEIGFWFTTSTQRSSTRVRLSPPGEAAIDEFRTYEATDLYAFYFRRRFGPALASTARFYTGFTGVNDGLLGADFEMPFNPGWALQAGATYLIPAQDQDSGAFAEESWNVFVGAVWRPRGFAQGDYHRPLFRVAGNGSFLVDRTQ